MTFYNKLLIKCAAKGVTPSAAAKAIGLSNAAASGWKDGGKPNDVNMLKLAMYLDCTVEDLQPDQEESEKPAPENGNGPSAEARKMAILFDRAEPWLQAQVMALLEAAESHRAAQGGDHKDA